MLPPSPIAPDLQARAASLPSFCRVTAQARTTPDSHIGIEVWLPFRADFEGCSTGGQQALSEAQRYPTDYDGILAGDPGNDRAHVASIFL